MSLPNFIIAGAPKAGTTTLCDLLLQHPEVGMSYIKEPNFFSDGWPQWAQTLGEYQELFSHCRGKNAIGEASPCYIYDPASPHRIRETLGRSARIVLILRHPVRRAFSHWSHEYYRYGRERLSFEQALLAEEARGHSQDTLNKRFFFHGMYRYSWGSQYADKVARFLETFGKEQVFVVIFELLIADVHSTFARLCRFLEIDDSFAPTPVHANFATEPVFPLASKAISMLNQMNAFCIGYRNLTPGMRRRIFKTGSKLFWSMQRKRRDTVTPIEQSVYDDLMADFLPDIQKLETILGCDLSIWYSTE